jgi:hypothetical protein
MAITGTKPFFKFQAGIEGTPGVAVPATRIQPIVSGNMVEHAERTFIAEERGSLIKNYRAVATKQYVELTGIEVAPTYEDLAWWLQFFAKGGVSGVQEDTTAYRYTFTPTATADNLKTATIETGDNTQGYQVPFCVGTRMELTLARNAAATMTVDFLGQQATAAAFTGALSDRVTEDIQGALTAVYINASGGTIGNTLVNNVLDVKIGLETAQTQFFALNGQLYPVDVYRNAPRSATVEMTMAFNNTTEYAAFKSNFNGDDPRLIRVKTEGSVCGATTTKKTVQFDLYTVWAEAPFGEQDGLRVIQLSGETIYYPAATADWNFQVVNGLATLP